MELLFFIFFVIIAVICTYLLGLKLTTIITIVVVALVLPFVAFIFNKLMKEHIKISEAKSNIKIYLEQRYNEIGALYKIAEEFKLHESKILNEIVELRSLTKDQNDNFTEKTKIENQIEVKMPELMATLENYPELKSNKNYLKIQESIQQNEDNISASRKSFNAYVNRYNTSISILPYNLFATLLGFKKETFYEAPNDKLGKPIL